MNEIQGPATEDKPEVQHVYDNKIAHFTKKGPGRKHSQGPGKESKLYYTSQRGAKK